MKACGVEEERGPLWYLSQPRRTVIPLLSASQLETKSVIGFDPCYTPERTPQYPTRAFCCKFEKAFLSWDLLCCGRDLSWLGTMNQMERRGDAEEPPLEIFIILNRKDSECLSPWDCIISPGSNPIDTQSLELLLCSSRSKPQQTFRLLLFLIG